MKTFMRCVTYQWQYAEILCCLKCKIHSQIVSSSCCFISADSLPLIFTFHNVEKCRCEQPNCRLFKQYTASCFSNRLPRRRSVLVNVSKKGVDWSNQPNSPLLIGPHTAPSNVICEWSRNPLTTHTKCENIAGVYISWFERFGEVAVSRYVI